VIWVEREFIDPPEREEVELPEIDAAIETAVPRFNRKLELPQTGII
jgi:hypothetical protein